MEFEWKFSSSSSSSFFRELCLPPPPLPFINAVPFQSRFGQFHSIYKSSSYPDPAVVYSVSGADARVECGGSCILFSIEIIDHLSFISFLPLSPFPRPLPVPSPPLYKSPHAAHPKNATTLPDHTLLQPFPILNAVTEVAALLLPVAELPVPEEEDFADPGDEASFIV